jgi:hypothetical protein
MSVTDSISFMSLWSNKCCPDVDAVLRSSERLAGFIEEIENFTESDIRGLKPHINSKAIEILRDSDRRHALRDLLSYSKDEVEADGYISDYLELLPIANTGDDLTKETDVIKKKLLFTALLFDGEFTKLGNYNPPGANDYEKTFYDYWMMLSAAVRLGWG